MHELSLATEMVRLIEAQSQSADFSRVKRIHLALGAFSCVSDEAFRFAFDSLRNGMLADTELVIDKQAVTAHCLNCGHEQAMMYRLQPCEQCGGDIHAETAADELRITELEVI